MRKIGLLLLAFLFFSFRYFDSSYYALSGGPFTQNWANTGLITANDNWSAVPGIQGFLGQDITTATGTDPQTLTGVSAIANDLDDIANQSNTNITNGGVAEFDGIPNPTIALQGSGTADAPHLIIYLNTSGQSSIRVQYNLRDIDGTTDNAVQPVALQYRVGSSGNFINLPAGFVADATTGPSLATLVTAIDVTLPATCDNQGQVEVRIITTNAVGNDEWVGVDDINISSSGAAGPLTITTAPPLAGGTVNTAYTQPISASGGALPYTFSVSLGSLPSGLGINPGTGTISGTPLSAGTSTFTIQVADGNSSTTTKDFSILISNPPCSPPTHTIAQIQGTGNTSLLTGNVETTNGIVTGIRSNGFFMQTPDASADNDLNSSEGIFVFTASSPPATVAIGNNVCVTGTISEFIPAADPNSPSQTEFISPTIVLLSTGNALPAPTVLTAVNTDPAGNFYQLEKYEGMRVKINSMTVVAPTDGNLSEANATSTTNGFFYGVVTGIARPFREPGIAQPDPIPSGAPATVTRWDANPELIGVGSSSIGGTAIDVAAGAILTNVVGPLDFRSRTYTIDLEPASPPVVTNNNITYTAVPVQTADELTVGSFNMERFYDDVNDPGGDAVLTTTAYNNRLNKVSLAIRNVLRSPDILGVIEMEKLSVLQAIATKVNNDAVAASQPNPNYQAYLAEGNDIGGIDVGFLVKSTRVNVVNVTQYGLTTTYTDPNTNSQAILNDRPPLVLNATFAKPSCPATAYPITVIVNHLRSLSGIDDPADGNRVRTKRKAEAEFLASLIQGFQVADPNVNIISVGDYNAFEFSDGYADVIGTIKGTPAPAASVVLSSADLVNPDLTDLMDSYPASQRYSYSFAGSAQVLDHILVNAKLAPKISRFSVGRVDADFPEIYRNDANRPERISDHDAPLAYILFTDVVNPVITCPSNIIVNTTPGQCNAVVNFTVTATDNCSVANITSVPASGSTFPKGITTVISTATDPAGNSSTCSFTVTVNDGQPPVINTQPVNKSACANDNVNFTVSASAVVSYQWQVNTGSGFNNISGATGATLTLNNVTTAMSGYIYHVTLIGLCSTVISGNAVLTVNALPTISLSAAPFNSLKPGEQTTITATTVPATGGVLNWTRNGNIVNGLPDRILPGITIDGTGTYKVVYKDVNGCITLSADLVISATVTDHLYIYPNPSRGQFQVRYYTPGNIPLTISIYNSKGSRVYRRQLVSTDPYTRIDVDLGNQANGIYQVELRGTGGKKIGKNQVLIIR